MLCKKGGKLNRIIKLKALTPPRTPSLIPLFPDDFFTFRQRQMYFSFTRNPNNNILICPHPTINAPAMYARINIQTIFLYIYLNYIKFVIKKLLKLI